MTALNDDASAVAAARGIKGIEKVNVADSATTRFVARRLAHLRCELARRGYILVPAVGAGPAYITSSAMWTHHVAGLDEVEAFALRAYGVSP